MRKIIPQERELLGIQRLSSSHKTSIPHRQILLIILGQQFRSRQLTVEGLTDATVGTIGSYEDIADVAGLITAVDGDAVFELLHGENLFREVDLVRWDLGEEEGVEVLARKD